MSCFWRKHYFFIPHATFLVMAFIAFLVLDRTPPLILYDGKITPETVVAGQGGVTVKWRAHFSGRDCPGFTQRELVDSENNLWPKRKRNRGGVFHPSENDPLDGTVTTPPLSIPLQMMPGRAYYRVTQFYYCTWFQRAMHWPIVQRSVRIPFYVEDGAHR